MKQVRVKRTELLERVKANRELHETTYEEAIAGYKTLVANRIGKLYAEAKYALDDGRTLALNRIERSDPQEQRLGDTVVLIQAQAMELEVPISHVRDYDQVIEMLTMSIEDEMSIDSTEFARYVMDRWEWQEQFRRVTSTYRTLR